MRVTVKHLRARVALLNKIFGRPEQHWEMEGGRIKGANPGHLLLESHGNGSGHRWYTLNEVCARGQGERQVSTGYNGQEMDAYITGLLDSQDHILPKQTGATEALRAVLLWARTPGNHGGNPYMHGFVKQAERTLAKIEGRPTEDWAGGKS